MSILEYLKKQETRNSLIVIGIFFLISLFYFSPLLNKKVLQQSDTILVQGMSKNIEDYRAKHNGEEPYWSTTMFSGMPSYTISANYDGNIIQYIKIALDLGLPHPIGILFIGMLFFFLLARAFQANVWIAAGAAIAYGFTTYHILIMEAGHYQKIYSLMYAPGVLAGLVYLYRNQWWLVGSLFLFLTLGLEIYAAHIQMTYYLLFVIIPYLIFELIRAFFSHELKNFMLASLLSAGIAILSLLTNANNLYPLYQYQKLSIRGASELQSTKEELKSGGLDKDYAYAWSQGRVELTTFLIPNAVGGASGTELGKKSASYKLLSNVTPNALEILKRWPTYWGDQSFTSGPYYSGILTIIFAILALYLYPSPLKLALLYAIMLSFLLALGKNSFSVMEALILLSLPVIAYFKPAKIQMKTEAFGTIVSMGGLLLVLSIAGEPTENYRFKDLFFDYLPLYNKFRVPSSMLTIAQLALPLLALLGISSLLNPEIDAPKKQTAFFYAFGIISIVLLLLWIAPSILYSFTSEQDNEFRNQLLSMTQNNKPLVDSILNALIEDREQMLKDDILRGLFFIAVMGAATWFYLKGSLSATLFGILFAVLTFADLYSLSRRYLNNESYTPKREYQNNFQPRETDAFLTQKDTSYYRVFPLDRNPFNDGRTVYHLRSIGGYNAAKIKRYQQLIEKHLASTLNPQIISMLNTKYLLTAKPLDTLFYQPVYRSQEGEFIYQNKLYFGPCWLVNNVLTVKSPDEALDTIGKLNLREQAVIEEKDKSLLQPYSNAPLDSSEYIQIISWDNTLMTYEAECKENRFAVFSEVFYNRGWKAFIDDKEVPILQTNFVLRGINIPAGKHKITFKFDPDDVKIGEMLSYIGSSILILLGIYTVAWVFRKKENEPTIQV